MAMLETPGFEQTLQEQNDILRRFMEAEFGKQALILKDLGFQIGLLAQGSLPSLVAASEVAEEPPEPEDVQEIVKEQIDLLSSWHPKPDHSKAVPNAGLQCDEDGSGQPGSSEAHDEGGNALPDLAEHHDWAKERQVSAFSTGASKTSEQEKPGGRRPSTSGGLSSIGLQLKSVLQSRQSVKDKGVDDHQKRALRASNSFMSDRTEGSMLSPTTQCLRKVVSSSIFSYGIMFLILANMVILGVEVDTVRSLPPTEEPDTFFIVNNVIVCCFLLEILLKIRAYGCSSFFCGRERGWNIFDCIIVGLSFVESASDIISRSMANSDPDAAPMDSSHLRVVRFTRVIRALRGVRVVRLLRFISSLRAILFSISSTMWSLVWTLVLLVILFYCFGVIIAQLVSDHCRYATHSNPGDAQCMLTLQMWDGVLESMMTLFHSISGGLSWVEAFTPLREISGVAAAFMYVYIVITVFAVLNVVTGVFCNTAIENAKADKDIAVMKQMQKHRTQVESLRTVFNDIDVNQSKLVNLHELKAAMEEQKLSSFMESMDISTKDIWTLFMLIDADESGEISIDEFVSGCMQLQGPAKSIQLARVRHENNLMRRDIRNVLDEVKAVKKSLRSAEPKRKSKASDEDANLATL